MKLWHNEIVKDKAKILAYIAQCLRILEGKENG